MRHTPFHRAGNDPVVKRRLTTFGQGLPRDAQSLVPHDMGLGVDVEERGGDIGIRPG